jgi:hypothetical protein
MVIAVIGGVFFSVVLGCGLFAPHFTATRAATIRPSMMLRNDVASRPAFHPLRTFARAALPNRLTAPPRRLGQPQR